MKYNGYYQNGDTILEKLAGPMGNGSVEYDNGDFFEGLFHLNFAHIYGPCYCARGKYSFADGSFIEDAWIVTSKSLDVLDLLGVFKVQKAGEPDRWVSFLRNKRHGYELVLDSTPYAVEWHEGEKIQEIKISSYNIDQQENGCVTLEIKLPTGFRVVLEGGHMCANDYGSSYYDPQLKGEAFFPDGSSYSCYNWNMKDLQPWDGWVTAHFGNGRYQGQRWENGVLVEKDEMKYDERGADQATLPDPLGSDRTFECLIWDDYIRFGSQWEYRGGVADGKPNGQGVFQDRDQHRYEGAFRDGMAHGQGVYTYEPGSVRKEGVWVNGVFQNPEKPSQPISLHFSWNHEEWSIGGSGDTERKEWDWEAREGDCGCSGFYSLKLEKITDSYAVFSNGGGKPQVLTPGSYISFSESIDGYEDHDGVTWNGDDYGLCISWPLK